MKTQAKQPEYSTSKVGVNINEPKKRMSLVDKIVLPIVVGGLGVLSIIGAHTLVNSFFPDKNIRPSETVNYYFGKVNELKTEETLNNIPKSTYSYHPEKNWSYWIDIERDGKEDITISDHYKRIKEIMPVERGYKIILNTDEERKDLYEILGDNKTGKTSIIEAISSKNHPKLSISTLSA